MRKTISFLVVLVSLSVSTSAFAFQYAYAFHDPLMPSSAYRIDQDHKEYNSAYGKYHIGEDRNRINVQECGDDAGDAVYSIANGRVMYAQNAGPSWGNVIIVRHILHDMTRVHSMYAHLQDSYASVGQEVSVGQQIGSIGDAGGYYPCAHLHFELRTDRTLEKIPGSGYAYWGDPIWNSHTDPSDFISSH
ncbi:peptidoglycan DD-metalloendopeptidase family protein [Patescibacteria group bacterium]